MWGMAVTPPASVTQGASGVTEGVSLVMVAVPSTMRVSPPGVTRPTQSRSETPLMVMRWRIQ